MERHGVILLLELKLLAAPPAACSWGSVRGGAFWGLSFIKSTYIFFYLNILAKEFKRKQKCEIIHNHATGLFSLRGNFLFRQLRRACCGMTTVRKSGGHVATSKTTLQICCIAITSGAFKRQACVTTKLEQYEH